MHPCALFWHGLWWIFPLVMIAMFVFCFFMMRQHGMSFCGGRSAIEPRRKGDDGRSNRD
jgi:hypothetical protein